MSALTIAVVGAGKVGSALAAGWSAAGHQVVFADRDTPRSAALQADVVVIAVPGAAVADVARALGPLEERVIVDATNVVGGPGLPDGRGTAALRSESGSPHVVKCFNTTGFENMRNPRYGETAIDMFCAGSSAHGKTVAARLARDLGFAEVYDLGGDHAIPLLEALALVWINLAIVQKQGRDIGLKILRR